MQRATVRVIRSSGSFIDLVVSDQERRELREDAVADFVQFLWISAVPLLTPVRAVGVDVPPYFHGVSAHVKVTPDRLSDLSCSPVIAVGVAALPSSHFVSSSSPSSVRYSRLCRTEFEAVSLHPRAQCFSSSPLVTVRPT